MAPGTVPLRNPKGTSRKACLENPENFVRPQKWEDSQVGFRGSSASGRRIVLLPGAFWAHSASKMAILGASFLLCISQCFRVWEGMLPARRVSHEPCFRQAHCFVQGPLRFFPVLPNPTCTRSHIWGLSKIPRKLHSAGAWH